MFVERFSLTEKFSISEHAEPLDVSMRQMRFRVQIFDGERSALDDLRKSHRHGHQEEELKPSRSSGNFSFI